MKVTYKTDTIPDTESIIELYRSSGINRPVDDRQRIAKMYTHSNLVTTAWDGDLLVGIARYLTDYCCCCYLSDLAVRREYQGGGIGRQLISITKEHIGDQTMLLLLSAPGAMDYYPKLGFKKVANGYILERK
jgi:GNAT superfamily N-acetyltransferase